MKRRVVGAGEGALVDAVGVGHPSEDARNRRKMTADAEGYLCAWWVVRVVRVGGVDEGLDVRVAVIAPRGGFFGGEPARGRLSEESKQEGIEHGAFTVPVSCGHEDDVTFVLSEVDV